MTSGLAWLNDLMLWLGRWFPHIVLVKQGEAAMWFGRGGRTAALVPGLYCYWPITSEVKVVSTKLRTLEMCGQVNGSEAVALIITWRLVDVKALLLWNDVPANLDDRCTAYLHENYSKHLMSAEIAWSVRSFLRTEFEPTGIEVSRVDVAQRGPIITLRNMSDWSARSDNAL